MVPLNVAFYVSRDPADFRKQCDGLCGLVRSCLGRDPSDQCLYIFFNRRRDQVKILYYSPGGYCLWWKRLERGSFATIDVGSSVPYITLTSTELLMLIDGISRIYLRERYLQEHRHRLAPDNLVRWRRRTKALLEHLLKFCQGYDCVPKSPIGKACNYFRKYYRHLVHFCEDGTLPIDNNVIERLIRIFVIGRKAWIFSSSEEGARSSATLWCSPVSSMTFQ